SLEQRDRQGRVRSGCKVSDNGCMRFVFTCNGKEALLLPTYPRTTWLCMDRTRHSMAEEGRQINPLLQRGSRQHIGETNHTTGLEKLS
ncbi:hypothetical protein NQZ68_029737, partial [Dissostichus eleginoides]